MKITYRYSSQHITTYIAGNPHEAFILVGISHSIRVSETLVLDGL